MLSIDEIEKRLKDDLQEPLIPSCKRFNKRSKKGETEESNIIININKARRSRYKAIKNKLGNDDSKDQSDSSSHLSDSDDSVSSTERDDLIRKYFRKVLCPILEEEREHNK